MNWPEMLTTGGGWGVALFVAWLVWRGELVLKREYEAEQALRVKESEEAAAMALRLEASQESERTAMAEQIRDLQAENQRLREGGA